MKIKEGLQEEWNHCLEINSHDPYSLGTVTYAIRWAELLEEKILKNKDKTPEEIIFQKAEELSSEADTEGITGFMYGCSVSMLSMFWIYGEELRKWHNKKYEYEGMGVVNPAVMGVSI